MLTLILLFLTLTTISFSQLTDEDIAILRSTFLEKKATWLQREINCYTFSSPPFFRHPCTFEYPPYSRAPVHNQSLMHRTQNSLQFPIILTWMRFQSTYSHCRRQYARTTPSFYHPGDCTLHRKSRTLTHRKNRTLDHNL